MNIKQGPNAQLDQTDADNYYITKENRELRAENEMLKAENARLVERIAKMLLLVERAGTIS
jgi:cell division protein FtsB